MKIHTANTKTYVPYVPKEERIHPRNRGIYCKGLDSYCDMHKLVHTVTGSGGEWNCRNLECIHAINKPDLIVEEPANALLAK